MNFLVCAMKTKSKKLRTPSSITWSIQIKSRQQVWRFHSTTSLRKSNIKIIEAMKHLFTRVWRRRKAHPYLYTRKSDIYPTRTNVCKPSLHTFNLHARHRMDTVHSWRTPERLESAWFSELEWQSSDKSQNRKSLSNHDVHMVRKIHLLVHYAPQRVYTAYPIHQAYKRTLQANASLRII
jgi:hypothetical protein